MLRSLGIRAKILAVLAVPVTAVAVISPIVVLIIGAHPGMLASLAGVGIIGIIAHFVVGSIIARSITRPLVELAAAADEVAESLPEIVQRVSANEQVEFSELPVESDDEVGRLTGSINELSTTTVNFARERAAFAKDQADVRGSIANMFVTVARRDQTLLKRVLSQVTDMERTEEDPDTLDKLFKLDHLATRMRRNAESLLVLAGRESSRRRRQPMPLTDVVRSASSEIEHYERVDLHQYIDPAMLGHAALPTSHLLAELLENATRYSDPSSRVTVEAKEGPKGVRITISDTGLGMSDAELGMFNDRIANPPTDDVIGTDRMGFYVVGRLADKLAASVVLSKAEPKGTLATVDLSGTLFVPGAVATTGEPAEDFGLGEDDWDAADPAEEAAIPPYQGTKTGHLTTGASPAAAALAAAAASQEEQITPQIKAAPARPGKLPGRGGGLPSRGALPARGDRKAPATTPTAPSKPAGGRPVGDEPAAAGSAAEKEAELPPSSHFGGPPAATPARTSASKTDPTASVPVPRSAGSAPSRASALTRRGTGDKREAASELSSLTRRKPAAAPEETAPAAPAPTGVTGASALDILPSGGGLGRGRGRKKITPQAPMPSASAIAAAAAASDEAYVPQAFVPKGPSEDTPAAEPADSGSSLSDVLRARSAMASAALSELSQLQGAPLVRRERGASEAGRFAAASQAAAQTPAPARPTRSAADVRSMLSGFQAGVSRGRSVENSGDGGRS